MCARDAGPLERLPEDGGDAVAYATMDGVGSAGEIDWLCGSYDAYRWLSVNYDTLSGFCDTAASPGRDGGISCTSE